MNHENSFKWHWKIGKGVIECIIIHILLKLKLLRRVNLGQNINFDKFDLNFGSEILWGVISHESNNPNVITILNNKSSSWADRIHTGNISKNEIYFAINYTILNSLSYHFPSTTLTEDYCKKILSPILQMGLNSIGICYRFSWAILGVYGNTISIKSSLL